ncbi:MAG: hypothetical protein ACLQBQ_07070 [Smithella sp.]
MNDILNAVVLFLLLFILALQIQLSTISRKTEEIQAKMRKIEEYIRKIEEKEKNVKKIEVVKEEIINKKID